MKLKNHTRLTSRRPSGAFAAMALLGFSVLAGCGGNSGAREIYSRGIAHYEKQELQKAAECFEKARSMDGSFTGAGIMLAKVRYFTGKRGEARDLLGDIIARDPSHVGALYWMARALVADAKGTVTDGDNADRSEKEAMEHLSRALDIDPHHIQARSLLGLLYEKNKMYREALREYSAALREEESLIAARANLGMLYRRLGLRDRARAEITRALKIAEAVGAPEEGLIAIRKEIEEQ